MRAPITTDYGATPEIADIPRPVPGPDEVLVKVAAIGQWLRVDG
ncbi:hypothetical protein ABT147_25730 [Streptomyces sp. NPDC001868]